MDQSSETQIRLTEEREKILTSQSRARLHKSLLKQKVLGLGLKLNSGTRAEEGCWIPEVIMEKESKESKESTESKESVKLRSDSTWVRPITVSMSALLANRII